MIAPAITETDLRSARQLFEEYARELGVDLCFQNFARELETLPGDYAPPRGVLLVARAADVLAGCVALRPMAGDVCEMKRLFVRPGHRRHGWARALVAEIIARAEAAGYRAMALDTLDWMRPAICLYESFGFERTAPYYDNPLPGAVYFRLRLATVCAELRCQPFTFGSACYRKSLQLREAVLRQPLGLSFQAEDLAGEEALFHLGCFAGDALVGTLMLHPLDGDTFKMRQVAVAPERQGQGVGSLLVRFAERFAVTRGCTTMVAHAREPALRFYRKHGYRVEGAPFLEVGIPHRRICKPLIPVPAPPQSAHPI